MRLPLFLLLLALSLARAANPRLANLSTRAEAGTGANVLIAGFAIGPGAGKPVLIRAAGPALGAFGLAGTLTDPVLTLFNAAGAAIAGNDNWLAADAATMTAVGAFAFSPGSRDAALVTTLAPGAYTAQVTPATGSGQAGTGGTTGLVLVEVYEVGATGAKLVNLSTRAQVGTGASVMIPGLAIAAGTGPRRLLVRAAGAASRAARVRTIRSRRVTALFTRQGGVKFMRGFWQHLD